MNMKTKLNYYEEYERIQKMAENELRNALKKFPCKTYEFIKEEDAEDEDFEVDAAETPVISVESRFDGSHINIAVTKVCIVRDEIEIWGFDNENESYDDQLCYRTWEVVQGELHWLIDYLPEPPEFKYTYKEMENAVHLSADLFMNLYEKWGDMMSVASFLIEKASELDKHLGGRDESEGNYDYVEELEKFEKKILAEL